MSLKNIYCWGKLWPAQGLEAYYSVELDQNWSAQRQINSQVGEYFT